MEGMAIRHNFEGTDPGTIPARFGLIWLSGFRGEDLNVIFYQNMPNLQKPQTYVKLLLAMQLQLKFELILTYTKAAIDN